MSDTTYTDNIICPYPDCGYEESDSWEYSELEDRDARITCPRCDREFWAFREITVTYHTRTITWKLDGGKEIDRCCQCSHHIPADAKKEEWSPVCSKSGKKILYDTKEDIPDDCQLPDWEEGGECDTDDIEQDGYENECWSELHDAD